MDFNEMWSLSFPLYRRNPFADSCIFAKITYILEQLLYDDLVRGSNHALRDLGLAYP